MTRTDKLKEVGFEQVGKYLFVVGVVGVSIGYVEIMPEEEFNDLLQSGRLELLRLRQLEEEK